MSQKTTMLAIVAFAVGALVTTYFLTSSEPGVPEASSVPSNTSQGIAVGEPNPSVPSKPEGKKMPFAEFIKQGGGAYKCTVHQSVQGVDSSGVTYISGGMIRGEYETQVNGTAMATTMIVRNGYSYTWTSMMPNMGFKAKIAESTPVEPNAPVSAKYAWNAQEVGEYDCEAWTADVKLFTLPSGINWTDVSTK